MYTGLIVWMSYSLQTYESAGATSILSLGIAFGISTFLSVLYGLVIINNRRMEIATLKCIGYTNSNIQFMILGELLWVTLVSFFIVSEFLIHHLAIVAYYLSLTDPTAIRPFINIPNLVITVALFSVAQVAGIWVSYRKILKLRPIIALRVMK